MENRIKMILGKKREEMQKERHEHDMNQHEVWSSQTRHETQKSFQKEGNPRNAKLYILFLFYCTN